LVRVWGDRVGHHTLTLKIGEVFAPMLVASGGYFLICLWLKVPYTHDLLRLVRRQPAQTEEIKP
jgi:hypothetical protein